MYQSASPHKTEIVKDVLINAGLNAIVFTKQDHAYKFGSIDVMVDPDSVMRAIKIIEEEIKFDHE